MSDEVNFENVDALPDVENNAEAAAVAEEPQEAPVEATEETEAPVEEGRIRFPAPPGYPGGICVPGFFCRCAPSAPRRAK